MWVQKSLDMKNFIFKSSIKSTDFHKIFILINQIQTEQRHARGDLKMILNEIHTLIDSLRGPAEPITEDIPEQEELE